MSGENRQEQDQERFEDYLELEHFVEELRAGRVAHPPVGLAPSQARIYRMAALFRSASPEAAEPRPEFATKLQAHLEQQLVQSMRGEQFTLSQTKVQKKPSNVSRRALLTSGAAMAASLAVGAGIDHIIESAGKRAPLTGQTQSLTPTPTYPKQLLASEANTTWHFVTTLALLGNKAVPFATETVLGYVIRDAIDRGNTYAGLGNVIAVSASCTHMGCIVKWQDADRKFHCPCHGGLFAANGEADSSGNSPILYLRPLPRLQTKIENGNVYVEVPVSIK